MSALLFSSPLSQKLLEGIYYLRIETLKKCSSKFQCIDTHVDVNSNTKIQVWCLACWYVRNFGFASFTTKLLYMEAQVHFTDWWFFFFFLPLQNGEDWDEEVIFWKISIKTAKKLRLLKLTFSSLWKIRWESNLSCLNFYVVVIEIFHKFLLGVVISFWLLLLANILLDGVNI